MADGTSGGSEDLRVEDDSITRLLGDLDQAVEFLRGDHSQLTAMLSDVTGGWQGAAASQFNTGQSDTNINLDRLIQALSNLRELVQMSRDGFQGEEEERVSELRAVNAGLDDMNPAILNM
jgi:WXG100 family type VII secretion target